MDRNEKGFIGFASVTCILTVLSVLILGISASTLLLPGVAVFIGMVCREYYQFNHYSLPRFEWEDIALYGISIFTTTIILTLIAASFGLLE